MFLFSTFVLKFVLFSNFGFSLEKAQGLRVNPFLPQMVHQFICSSPGIATSLCQQEHSKQGVFTLWCLLKEKQFPNVVFALVKCLPTLEHSRVKS
jgi:hypothetical protein